MSIADREAAVRIRRCRGLLLRGTAVTWACSLHGALAAVGFENLDYWQETYEQDRGVYEWYGRSYEEFKELFAGPAGMLKTDKIAMLGCGDSALSADMYRASYEQITNVDFSPRVVERMRARHADMPSMTWQVGDVTNLEAFADGSFDIAIDKGTLDAVSSGPAKMKRRMLEEVHRILTVGGRYIHITPIDERFRMNMFAEMPRGGWTCTVHPIKRQFSAIEDYTVANHFVYICTKQERPKEDL
eukprot:gnl/TRDRNA2_/TRDRNA2_121179_c2_seq1.p1 gnl/TRDRNA2_/TRDRNA2_121179_c2~~gnl/TRDRNA2_/TRDRNA2_121179_c2_seq1.p1  ORF type:complete len:269 (+),score=47.32 gnl/TRDRNA2_/TRDRNA2_121179_c2_seq1:77-808(+)